MPPSLSATLLIAQAPLTGGKVEPLPGSPFMARFLFENPWPGMIALALSAVVVFVILNQRGRLLQGAALAGGLAGLAGVVWLTARLVETPREALRARTSALIAAVLRGDDARMREILEPEAVAYFPEAPGGVRILDWVPSNLTETYRIREWAILEEQSSLDGPGTARTQFHVRVSADDSGLPYLGWVRFNWREDPEGWKVRSVEEVARGLRGQ